MAFGVCGGFSVCVVTMMLSDSMVVKERNEILCEDTGRVMDVDVKSHPEGQH